MPSETTAEERGMAQHIRENREQIRMDAAREVAEKIQNVLYSHGLGNFKYQSTDMEILARHIAAASAEWTATRPWNQTPEACPDCNGAGEPLPDGADHEEYSKCGNCKGWTKEGGA